MIVKSFNSIKEINEQQWNALINPDDIQQKYGFYLALEESKTADFIFKYIAVFDNDILIAAMPAFITESFYVDIPLMGTIKKITGFFKKIFPGFLKIKVLFCGNPVSEYNVFLFNNKYDKFELLDLILKEFHLIAKNEKIKYTAFKDYKDITADIKKFIKKFKYTHVYSMPGTYIIHNVKTFDEYLQTLNKKNRHNIRNKINKSQGSTEIKIEYYDDFSSIIDEIFRLYENTYNKAVCKFEKLNREFFYNINKYMGNNKKVMAIRYRGKIAAFSLLLFSENRCINMRMGLDYSVAYDFYAYFLVLYENLKFIFDNKINTLLLSQSTYRPKLEIGAGIQVLDAFVRNRNPVFNFLMGKMCFLIYIKYRILSTCSEPHKKLKKLFPNLFSN